jgi:hypothetical protein
MGIDLRFNELSAKPLFDDKFIAHTKMMEFAKTANVAKNMKIKHIKSDYSTSEIDIAENYSMHDWLFDKYFSAENRNVRDFLQTMIIPHYIDDDKTDKFLSCDYFFEDNANGIVKQKCIGLASAYLYDALCISMQNGDSWLKNKLTILVEEDDEASIEDTVWNVYSSDCFLNEEIIALIEKANNVQPDKTKIPPEEKNAHFTDHHGKSELEHFWKKLVINPYVVSAKSTYWGGNKFIRNVEKTGIIEIVLVNTERRYAMLLQTTGRTYNETEYIAKILEKDYA